MSASDLVSGLLGDLPEPDQRAAARVRSRAASVLRPAGALARLDEVAAWLGGWQRTSEPRVDRPAVVVFAADHGVVTEDVSPYPSDVTAAMVKAIDEGVATVSAMARDVGASVRVVDVGVGVPTGNLMREPALTEERFAEALESGRDAVGDTDLLALGEIGIGNTTSAAAVVTALLGGDRVGPGSGAAGDRLERKRAVVDAAAARARDMDPVEILRQVGGAELVAMCGAVMEARRRSIPVVLDGFVVAAAVLPLHLLHPGALDHCVAGHRSAEPGHGRLLDELGLSPLLDLEMRLGEGSGAVAAIPLVRLAAASVRDVATFEEWGLERP
jgi:nicotinate-nucleotide--dimethylbenzimidazole phosphoribosyltransferase